MKRLARSRSMSTSLARKTAAAASAAVAATVVLAAGFSAPAAAAEKAQQRGFLWCVPCVVTAAGPTTDGDRIAVRLRDPKGRFSERWFEARNNQANVLATALAAITSGKNVHVGLSDTVEYSPIVNFYLLR